MQTIYFAGDINNGNLYYFEVNDNRTGLHFGTSVKNDDSKSDAQAGLQDLVADNSDDNSDELSAITFGTDFGRITDIERDGLMDFCIYYLIKTE